MMNNSLPVHLYGHVIGHLFTAAQGGAAFEWASPAQLPWELNAPILSAQIPVGYNPTPDHAESFFGALLPEGQWRTNLAREIGCADTDTVAMLERVGRDTVGALSIGEDPQKNESVLLSPVEVAESIRTASGYFFGGGGSSALPGFQRKIALTKTSAGWVRGHGTMPSTHIFKPEPDVDNVDAHRLWHAESYMLALARNIGLTTFNSEVIDFSDTRALVIERYDRVPAPDGIVQRLHQEDFSQALGLPWSANSKFESSNPDANHRAMARLLDQNSTAFGDEFAQRRQLLSYVVFNIAIGNTDAHTKNYSIIRPERGAPLLAPLYDPTPLAFNFEGRQELALFVDHQRVNTLIDSSHFVNEGVSWGIPEPLAATVVTETLQKLDAALQAVSAPETIHEHINGYLRERVMHLLAGETPQGAVQSPIPASIRAAQGTLGMPYPRVAE